MVVASEQIHNHFKDIEEKLSSAYKVATKAREKGYDPEGRVDIPIAKSMAERVEGLISVVESRLAGSGMTARIEELEKEYGALSWRVALLIAEEVAKEKFCTFDNKVQAMEMGIRVGFAYHTCGIVAAPLEGFIELKIKKRRDGKEYFVPCYAGPIRGAGGTAASFSLLIVDYIRVKMGYSTYDPSEEEVSRFVTEIQDYHERITNLQYFPSEQEIRFLASHIPIEVDGDPTEQLEVSNYKDLPRVQTNRIRGGICLVLAEGLAQKAPKIWKRVQKWGKDFGLDWDFLKDFLALQKKIKAGHETTGDGTQPIQKISPNYTFIADLVAGRPVLTHPMREGGFRLRYGRSRTTGFSAAGVHPITQLVLNNYVATGTQLKLERPGKAAAITPCDTIDGPILKLKNGNVVQPTTETEVKQYLNDIKEILFLGDMLISYGDFSENGHSLVPPGYCEEWYVQELEKATVDMFGNLDIDRLSELVNMSPENLALLLKNPHKYKPSAEAAILVSKKTGVPLHPVFTPYWKLISVEQLITLVLWLDKAKIQKSENIEKIILPLENEPKRVLELLGIPHVVATNEFVVIGANHSQIILSCLGIREGTDIKEIVTKINENKDKNTLEIINLVSETKIRDKCGIFIGARMGRPEKAKMRKLTGSPQVLFPVGEEGGRLRCFQSSLETGKVRADFPIFHCADCNSETVYGVCERCGKKTKRKYVCNVCGLSENEKCAVHGENATFTKRDIDIRHFFEMALKQLKTKTHADLIKGVKGTSNKDHIPEHLIKGILRAEFDIYVNKDGTTRYDMTELPITHFKPKEIRTSVEKLIELGYSLDIKGQPLTDKNQILELKPQDIILPAGTDSTDETSDDVLLRVANFVDKLLVKLYGLKSFYNLNEKDELIGHLVIGLAPHISAGMLGRIIGFSETQGCYAHPLFHAAMRRDCDGDECCVILLMDALLNFSRQFLPNMRGSRTMDSPLVLTSIINPAEVDDMVHGLDVVWRYPLDFYNAALEHKKPWDVDIEQIKNRLGTEKQYEKMGFTHDVGSINMGVRCSAYKTLPSMEEKLRGQMEIAEKIRAVNESEVAAAVIEKHFLKDIKGNLRKFSMQEFRCVNCNEKFRRPPLIGKCTKCSGKIIFTISEGSVVKYLLPSISLANKYDVPAYLKQSLEITKRRIEGVFGKEKEKQTGLGAWFG